MKDQNETAIKKADTDSQIALRDATIKKYAAEGMEKHTDEQGVEWMVDPMGERDSIRIGPTLEGRKQDWTEKYQGGQQQIAEGNLRENQKRTGIAGMNAQTYRNQPTGYVGVGDQFTANVAAAQEVAEKRSEICRLVIERTGTDCEARSTVGEQPC